MIPHCLTADNIQGLSDYEFPKFLVRFLSMLFIIRSRFNFSCIVNFNKSFGENIKANSEINSWHC